MRYCSLTVVAAIAAFCLMPARSAQAGDRWGVSFGYSNYGHHGSGYGIGFSYSSGHGGYRGYGGYGGYCGPRYYPPSYSCGPTYYAPRYYAPAPVYYTAPPVYYSAPAYCPPTYYHRPAYHGGHHHSGPIYRNTRVYFRDDYRR